MSRVGQQPTTPSHESLSCVLSVGSAVPMGALLGEGGCGSSCDSVGRAGGGRFVSLLWLVRPHNESQEGPATSSPCPNWDGLSLSLRSVPHALLETDVLLKMLLFVEMPVLVHTWAHSHVEKCCV